MHHAVLPEREIQVQHTKYTLKSVICHLGATTKIGHYTLRMHFPTGSGDWWFYNDGNRKLAAPHVVATTTPYEGCMQKSYILFYEVCSRGA